jgi:Tfp pilus assembly protein PilF
VDLSKHKTRRATRHARQRLFRSEHKIQKSPQARSEAYLAAALDAHDQSRPSDAAAAAMEAVRLNPAAPQGWKILSKMLQQNGQETAARQANVIASKLQHNPADTGPLYAMPAELKLSFLAAAQTDMP